MAQNYSIEEVTVLRETAFQAYQKALTSKSSELGRGRRVERQSIADLEAAFLRWDAELARLTGQGSSIALRSGVPVEVRGGYRGWRY